MAIALECYSLIVPVTVIERKYPGGWRQCLHDHGLADDIPECGACWHDGQLFRDGAMNPFDLHMLIERWKKLGFRETRRKQGRKISADFCIHAMFSPAPVHPCEWIDINADTGMASFAGIMPSADRGI